MFTFSDESSGGFLMSARSLQYLYGPPGATEILRLPEPHPHFIRNMSIVIDAGTGFVLNILDADQELLFVNSKESTNFTILKLVSSSDQLEQAIVDIDEQVEQIKAVRSKAANVSELVHRRLDSLETHDLATLDIVVAHGCLVKAAQALVDILAQLNGVNAAGFYPVAQCEVLLRAMRLLVTASSLISNIDPRAYPDLELCDGLLVAAQFLSMFDSLVCGLDARTPPDLEFCWNLLSVIGTVSAAARLIGQITTSVQRDYDTMVVLVQLFSIADGVSVRLAAYAANLATISELSVATDKLLAELSTISTRVVCPVRGEVFFTESGSGCIEA
jgi:hypothetical protein